MKLSFWDAIFFRYYVSFRECIVLDLRLQFEKCLSVRFPPSRLVELQYLWLYCCVQYIVWHLRCVSIQGPYIADFLCKKDYSKAKGYDLHKWLQLQHFKWDNPKDPESFLKRKLMQSHETRGSCFFSSFEVGATSEDLWVSLVPWLFS